MRSLLSRAVMLLLIVRVFGAPMALRPHDRTEHPGGGLVFRICNWPDQLRISPSELVSIGIQADAIAPAPFLPHPPSEFPGDAPPDPLPPDDHLARYLHRSLGALRC